MNALRTVVVAASVAALAGPVHAELIYGLLNNNPSVGEQLVTIDTAARAVTSTVVLQTANTLTPFAGISVRPSNGQLYGVSADATPTLYRINPTTGQLAAVGTLPASGLIAFNPTSDTIRLISGTSNYRINPDTAATVATDGPLAYAPGDSGAGVTPSVTGIAYTNANTGATSTTLYDVDTGRDVLDTQNPPNSGTLNTVGLLGFNANTGLFGSGFTGFTISPTSGAAYLTDSSFATATTLYTVNLPTGIATNLGTISGLGDRSVTALSAVPEPAALSLLGVAAVVGLRRRRA